MLEFAQDGVSVVVGAAGGIGGALAGALAARRVPGQADVIALSRQGVAPVAAGIVRGRIDITDEASIAAAAAMLIGRPVRLVIVATGILHGVGLAPEKSYRALEGAALMQAYAVNTVGPALVAKHFLPLLAPRGRAVFAVLSARVGSIGDNRSGGWHGYRAAKAGLNMILRTLAIELARNRPEQICVGLHPGTVATGLSAPFQRGVAPGALFTPDFAADCLLRVIDGLSPAESGRVLAWDGQIIPE